MDRSAVPFADEARPQRSGVVAADDSGRIVLRVSPAMASALRAAVDDPSVDLSPLRFDDRRRGLAMAASLAKGVPARLLEVEMVAGALEVRAYMHDGWVRLKFRPGDFDPDAAWDFQVRANEAKLETPLL